MQGLKLSLQQTLYKPVLNKTVPGCDVSTDANTVDGAIVCVLTYDRIEACHLVVVAEQFDHLVFVNLYPRESPTSCMCLSNDYADGLKH